MIRRHRSTRPRALRNKAPRRKDTIPALELTFDDPQMATPDILEYDEGVGSRDDEHGFSYNTGEDAIPQNDEYRSLYDIECQIWIYFI